MSKNLHGETSQGTLILTTGKLQDKKEGQKRKHKGLEKQRHARRLETMSNYQLITEKGLPDHEQWQFQYLEMTFQEMSSPLQMKPSREN